MVNPFILDSNFFIQAHRMHYPMDVVPGFWLKVKELATEGKIVSIDKVKDEIHLNKDELTLWCNANLSNDFFKNTDLIIEQYIVVSNWAHSKSTHYNSAALNEFLDANEADAWLIAYSLANGGKIVTHETSEPNRKSKLKIPDVCSPLGIQCVNTIEMFRVLGEHF
ncbi:DUF4411 family protein [Arcticibacter eurypsychrophilus]|uniref:DUF4411 family protein n=1 Tax=Arcticibacter eurypsychrophilus TaxID=1434752 RepID=UPI00084E077A|nr:DUF4411 family protein [Arcticibacter eurypsychrophilus]